MNSYFSRVILVPSSVFLAVLFGGAFGSGREVVEFMTQHGPLGGFLSILTIGAVYVACLFICFELARQYGAFEYRGFNKLILGRAWVLYEFVITLGVIVALAICASSSGAVLNAHFGVPALLGGTLLLLLVVALNYGGRAVVERSMIYCVVALFALLACLLAMTLSTQSGEIGGTLGNESSLSAAVLGGFRYAITNAGFIPLLLFCATQLETRREALTAGIWAGIAGILPAVIFHLIFLARYPEVIDQTLPTYFMIEALAPDLLLTLYVIILFAMIVQTGVGVLHGAIERIDVWVAERTGQGMGKVGHAAFSAVALIASIGLASIGLVDLIAQGYAYLSIVFTLIFGLPLLLVGIPRILSASEKSGEKYSK